MVFFSYSDNGQCAGYAIAEIKYIPYYELFSSNKEKAENEIQDFYTRFVSGLMRLGENDNISYEILFYSLPVKNQIYAAQVKLYFIVRYIGTSPAQVGDKINGIIYNLKQDFENINYSFDVFENQDTLDTFLANLNQVDCSCVSSVARNEKLMGNAFQPGGGLYFNDVIAPTEKVNIARVTNVMTRFPHTAVSIQIIPTSFNENERLYFQRGRTGVNYMIGQVRIMQGMQPVDPFTASVASAFDYYCNAANEPVAYMNILVFAPKDANETLCSKLISSMENENEHTGAVVGSQLTKHQYSLTDNFAIAPWVMSNCLVYQERETAFWNGKRAPEYLLRLKYLFTITEIKTVFKYPFDDETVIGLEVRKYRSNREMLNQAIISEDAFKLGIIQNSSGGINEQGAHASVPLKDFTMHGLIVGTPGSGKTYFSLGLLVQMWTKFNIPFLVVEPTKNEYRSMIDIIPELQVFTPGKSNISPFIINPFIPPKNVTVETYISSLMTAFKAAFSMPSPLPDIFLAAINESYNEYGWRMDSTADDPHAEPFGMYEFIRVFKRKIRNMDYKGDVKSNIESAGVVRLVSLLEQNSNIYDNIHTIPLEDLISKPTVIELNAINNKEQKSLIMAFVLILICTYTKNNTNYEGGLKNLLLIDEAHVILGSSASSEEGAPDAVGSTSSTIEDMIAEVRACGTSIIIADQSPEKVGKGIVGNTNVKVVFRLVEKTAKDIIRNAINLSDLDYDRLATLGMGEAILHHGKLKTEPLKIKTYATFTDKPFRKVIADKDLTPLCCYWDDKPKLLIPHKECANNCFCQDSCDSSVKTNADFIASRVLNAYYSKINTPNDMIKHLWTCNKTIEQIASQRGLDGKSPKLINCVKIKLLRKILIAKNFDVSRNDYDRILAHDKFLMKEKA